MHTAVAVAGLVGGGSSNAISALVCDNDPNDPNDNDAPCSCASCAPRHRDTGWLIHRVHETEALGPTNDLADY